MRRNHHFHFFRALSLLGALSLLLCNCSSKDKNNGTLGDPKACRTSEHCKKYGFCTEGDIPIQCIVGSDADCAQSEVCQNDGHCTMQTHPLLPKERKACGSIPPEIVCEHSNDCIRFGFCSYKDNNCQLLSNADCRKTFGCKERGECALRKAGERCKPGSDEDCRKNFLCKEYGKCQFRDGLCRAGSDEDCKNSSYCEKMGLCQLRDGLCRAGSDEDCKNSKFCKALGDCTLQGVFCKAVSDEECKQSDLCKQKNQCKAKDGKCVQ